MNQACEKIKDMKAIDEMKVAEDKVTIALFQILYELFFSTYFKNRKLFLLIGEYHVNLHRYNLDSSLYA